MSIVKVLILRTAGTNCDEETAYAWELVGADTRRVHIRELIESPALLADYSILTVPGGFSYGDDISAGRILAVQLIHYLSDALRDFIASGKLILGICNGFQVLIKAGLLPRAGGANGTRPSMTLTQNDSARFEDRWVHLRCGGRPNAFLPPDRILTMPIAHGEGKLVAADRATLDRVVAGGHAALIYCDAQGRPGGYPVNPNGSEGDIAGLIDDTGRILGLMPHPERHIHATQHPQWTRRKADRGDGRLLFETAIQTARSL